jgi:hypothetical protein
LEFDPFPPPGFEKPGFEGLGFLKVGRIVDGEAVILAKVPEPAPRIVTVGSVLGSGIGCKEGPLVGSAVEQSFVQIAESLQ